jgi:hypothetical protein
MDLFAWTLPQRVIESPAAMLSKISYPSGISPHNNTTDHKHFSPLTSRFINRNHYTASSFRTVLHNNRITKKRKYLRPPCNAWTFLRRGRERVISFTIRPSCDQSGLQPMPLREPNLISKQRTPEHTLRARWDWRQRADETGNLATQGFPVSVVTSTQQALKDW